MLLRRKTVQRKRVATVKTGIYFNGSTNEITSAIDTEQALGQEWLQVSDDRGLRLLAVRKLLVERGIVEDPTTVYWRMPQPTDKPKLAVACEPESVERPRHGPLRMVRSIFRGPGRPAVSAG